ncbi:hypothetical protein ACH4A8_14725 [Streptomyces vietnamensis]
MGALQGVRHVRRTPAARTRGSGASPSGMEPDGHPSRPWSGTVTEAH